MELAKNLLSTDPLCPVPSKLQLQEPIDYSKTYQNISKYVKELRHKRIKLSGLQLEQLSRLAVIIVEFLEAKQAAKNPLFLQALITLDNSLNISGEILKSIDLTKGFFTSINAYFLQVCRELEMEGTEAESEEGVANSFKKIIQTDKNPEQILEKRTSQKNFELYSIFYLVVMLIYETNRRQDHSLFMKYLLNGKFLSHFFSLELVRTNKMAKLVGIILTFFVKTLNLSIQGKNLKRFILNNLHLTGSDQRIQFYFFYSLRALKDTLLLTDVRKHHIIKFLAKSLDKNAGTQHAFYIYDLLQYLLRKYPLLGYSLLRKNFFQHLENDLNRFEDEILKIFEYLSPCIPTKIREACISMHLKRLSEAMQPKKSLSLRMVMILFQDIDSQEVCKEIMTSNILPVIFAKLNEDPSTSQEKLALKFLAALHQKAYTMNQNMGCMLYQRVIENKEIFSASLRSKDFLANLSRRYCPEQQMLNLNSGRCFSIL